jgi:hypothetical protein
MLINSITPFFSYGKKSKIDAAKLISINFKQFQFWQSKIEIETGKNLSSHSQRLAALGPLFQHERI